ncbi:phage tail terminator family protein [Anaeromassilibacillus senegalensis]|uniref:phage tail terminator family protein n=1 Tax=Anaeromassilibacillus senegalensis TaxID=1673717 RepID=UPI000682F919|nr:hypothetical protein [Anaeromassilibacillus senegalensis]
MLTYTNLIDAICAVLCKMFPGATAYTENCPQEFERPSYYIELKKWESIPATRCAVKCKAEFTLMYMGELDAHKNPIMSQLVDAQQKIISAFSPGKLAVGNRKLNISTKVDEAGPNLLAMTITVSYFDDTDEQAEQYQTIKTVETTIKEA